MLGRAAISSTLPARRASDGRWFRGAGFRRGGFLSGGRFAPVHKATEAKAPAPWNQEHACAAQSSRKPAPLSVLEGHRLETRRAEICGPALSGLSGRIQDAARGKQAHRLAACPPLPLEPPVSRSRRHASEPVAESRCGKPPR